MLVSNQTTAFSQTADNSKESFVIEKLLHDVIFAADGTGTEEAAADIRIQSDAAVKAFGLLRFPYEGAFEHLEIVAISVQKPDGSQVTTSGADVQDNLSTVSRAAPAYSDSRTKEVPVKGLGVGDVLHWHIRKVRTAAPVPGHFWYVFDFFKDGIILDEALTITVPVGKYVQVKSLEHRPDTRTNDNNITYSWRIAQAGPSGKRTEAKQSLVPSNSATSVTPDIQITTFQNWAQVGRWYRDLQMPKIRVTPAIQTKAAELTRGLKTNGEKERAIYEYVATKFRYISVSFGAGRYEPHSSEEVLTNQYGDCKDKHTLLSALLKAVDIEARPALIATSGDFDPDVPSPAQFDHVITYIPGAENPLWLDATPGLAPFGMLLAPLRNKKTLVIPDSDEPALATTPEELPFSAEDRIEVKSKLDSNGTLTGHFDFNIRGDSEVLMRSVFHESAQAQWPEVTQGLANLMGYAGTVSKVTVGDPLDMNVAFHYAFDYDRKGYSDWAHKRVAPPLPPMVPPVQTVQSIGPAALGPVGITTYRATMELPRGYKIVFPMGSTARFDFADYSSTYSLNDNVLTVVRTFSRKASNSPIEPWQLTRFIETMDTDESQFIDLMKIEDGSSDAVDISKSVGAKKAEDLAYSKIQSEQNAAAKQKLIVAFEKDFPNSNQLPEALISLSRILAGQSDFAGAVTSAEKAVTAVARMKAKALNPNFKEWLTTLEVSANSNLAWAKQMLAWQQQQIRSNVTRKK